MSVYIANTETGSVWNSGSEKVDESKLPEGFKVATQQEIEANEKMLQKFEAREKEVAKINAEMIEKQMKAFA